MIAVHPKCDVSGNHVDTELNVAERMKRRGSVADVI